MVADHEVGQTSSCPARLSMTVGAVLSAPSSAMRFSFWHTCNVANSWWEWGSL